MAAAVAAPGEAPRYFSHPNYANSPLPEVSTTPGATSYVGNPLVDRAYATDNASGVFVVLDDAPLPAGMLTSFETWNQATAGGSFQPSAGLTFHAYLLRPTGAANEYTVVFDSGALDVPALATAGTSERVTFSVANLTVRTGDLVAFYGQGVPLDIGAGGDAVAYPATQPLQDTTVALGSADYPDLGQARTYSFGANVVAPDEITGGLRKFVDPLPDLRDLVATPDTTSYPGTDFYRIGLVEYTSQMHKDLANQTQLRGYVQLNADGTPMGDPSYLGPAIVAEKGKPVRVEFRNLLPTGAGGNLFLPVDTTVMGSGMTPVGNELMEANPETVDPQVPMCNDPATKPSMVADGSCYPVNRATLHLHGGITPWISDGTPHQWITPATEDTPFPQGVSVQNVPDMNPEAVDDPADGVQTFYYTNAQSARLMSTTTTHGASRASTSTPARPRRTSSRTTPSRRSSTPGRSPGPTPLFRSSSRTRPSCRTMPSSPSRTRPGTRRPGAARATSGCRTCTRRRRTRVTPPASTPTVAGPTVPGSGRPPPTWSTHRSTTRTTTRCATPRPGGASRRSCRARRTTPWAWRRSWTPRSSTARRTRR
ncbi:hypothetical protein [Georgenia muralis]|uniref:hypothetical protein n=1 Tax=Georgenia muralis TaxID=154117 RepID=UPI001FE894E3|nr:hypothetical protein [Georgenia muralis]